MKRRIARALRKLAHRIDPIVITLNLDAEAMRRVLFDDRPEA